MSQSYDDRSCVNAEIGSMALPVGVALCDIGVPQTMYKPNQDGVKNVYNQTPLALRDEKFYGNVMRASKKKPVVAGLVQVTSDQYGIDQTSCLNLGSEFVTLGAPPACAYGPMTFINVKPTK